jgi:hypothetical protein
MNDSEDRIRKAIYDEARARFLIEEAEKRIERKLTRRVFWMAIAAGLTGLVLAHFIWRLYP